MLPFGYSTPYSVFTRFLQSVQKINLHKLLFFVNHSNIGTFWSVSETTQL